MIGIVLALALRVTSCRPRRGQDQRFDFDRQGHQRRHDNLTAGVKGNGAHDTDDEKVCDGSVFPTRRHVMTRNDEHTTRLSGPSSIWIEVESVLVHRECCGSPVVLDVGELDLVDVAGIRFLNACEAKGISVLHCSPYIRAWMLRERARARKP